MKISIANIFKGDKVIWMIFFFLCIISLIEVFSSSSTLTYNKASYWGPIIKHGGILLAGLVIMVVVQNIDCKYFKIATIFLLIISAITLLWVLMAGQSTNGAQRWVSLFGLQFQPSEIAKGTIVLAVAQILSAMQTEDGTEEKTDVQAWIKKNLPMFSLDRLLSGIVTEYLYLGDGTVTFQCSDDVGCEILCAACDTLDEDLRFTDWHNF